MKRSKIKKIIYTFLALLCIWVIIAQWFIQKERWSDDKAYRAFKAANIPLEMHDTLINGTHLHYAVSGSENLPALVFVHGSPGSWMHYMKYLKDSSLRKKFKLIAIDRPGFGYSSFGEVKHLQEQSDLILPVLRSIKKDQPMYVVGHSMGGPVVVKMAADAPDLFTTIVIVAGAIDVSQEETETWRKVMEVKPLYYALPGAFKPSNTELLYLKKDLIPLQNDFKNITCNVLFVHGDADTWVPIQNIAYGKKMMVNAASIHADTLHGADHQIPWKNREELIGILERLY